MHIELHSNKPAFSPVRARARTHKSTHKQKSDVGRIATNKLLLSSFAPLSLSRSLSVLPYSLVLILNTLREDTCTCEKRTTLTNSHMGNVAVNVQ